MKIIHKVYICHNCCNYVTDNKKDMKKHFQRKNKCNCMTLYKYEEAELLSSTKKFIFDFDYTKLIHDDYIYIINNYYDNENIIKNDFKKNILLNEIKINNDKEDINQNKKEKEDKNNEENYKNTKYEKKKEFDQLYFNEELNKYVCDKCDLKYTTKYNFINHLNNEDACIKQQKLNNIMEKTKQNFFIKKEKELIKKEEVNKHIIQNNGNMNINNVSNVNNIQNNNNNTHNSTYNFAMNDFVHDRYDLSHIKDSFYEKKDFFIYTNFLNTIMENKNNQNLFFINNEAVFYTDNELNKMNADRAGYMILDKLSQSFDELISKQDTDAREYYKFITKYYHVIKGHYKHDTIYKEYDVDDRQFIYTANSRSFRSRDKYLGKMSSTLKKFNDNVRENMKLSGCEIQNIPLINPNIEDYASTRMRYRDLKDRD